MKNFAITGVAGYVAPRHLLAIKETNNRLIAAVDPHDSVGILDKYFENVSFFTEIERFDRHLEKLRKTNTESKLDYLSICSPNHLHDAHIRLALRLDADAICEKPLVLKPSNLDYLELIESETKRKVYTILQLRHHPSVISLKNDLSQKKVEKKDIVDLTYITSRGLWYQYSWKGIIQKSGGIASNIGIHFFDMLIWLFGEVEDYEIHLSQPERMSGYIEFKHAFCRWFLSISSADLPKNALASGKSTYRSIKVNDNEIDFTDGFTNLHTTVYQNILNGNGFGINEARPSIELVHNMRQSTICKPISDRLHNYLKVNRY